MAKKDGSFLVLFKDHTKKQVFLVFRSDYPLWVLTGGGTEKNESPGKAALREANEETGFKVKLIKPLGIYEIINKKGKKIRDTYLYEGRITSGTFKPEFPGCRGKWFSVDKLPFSMSHQTKLKIQDAAAHKEGKLFRKKRSEISCENNLHLIIRYPHYFLKFIFTRYIPKLRRKRR